MDELYYEAMIQKRASEYEDWLEHYGTPRHSGRYPWGSGKNPQRNRDLLARDKELKAEGKTDKEIAQILGYVYTDGPKKGEGNINLYRAARTQAHQSRKADEYRQTIQLHQKGYSNTAIAQRIGTTEGTVRNYLKRGLSQRMTSIQSTTDILSKQLKDLNGDYIDVGYWLSAHRSPTYR